MTKEELLDDCDTILLPDTDSLEEAHELLEPLKPDLFAVQLDGWLRDPSARPQDRSAAVFDQWFALEVHSMVLDLVEEPILREGDDGFDADLEKDLRIAAVLENVAQEEIENIQVFSAEVAEGLSASDEDFDALRQIIEALDVQATLTVENDEKIAYVRCVFGEDTLLIESNNTYRPSRPKNRRPGLARQSGRAGRIAPRLCRPAPRPRGSAGRSPPPG